MQTVSRQDLTHVLSGLENGKRYEVQFGRSRKTSDSAEWGAWSDRKSAGASTTPGTITLTHQR